MHVTLNVDGGRMDRRNRGARVLRFERLDQRIALDASSIGTAADALPWFEPSALTYSLAPDGTLVGSEPSSLFSKLAPIGSPQEWQAEIEKAFHEWLSILGTSIHSRADSGAPFGTFGPTQGDLRFGDIRIAAIPLAGDMIAEAIPHSVIAQGTWAGDILLNSNADWSSLHQVYSVALHEFGHVLGLEHSNDPKSPMFFHGVYDALTPTSGDIKKLKELYAGVDLHAHDDDAYLPGDDAGLGEESLEHRLDVRQAVPLRAVLSASARYSASAALSTQASSVMYQLQPIGEIDHAEFLNVVVSAKERFGLIPSVGVYDKSGDRIPSTILHNSEGVLVIQAKDVEPNQVYYVVVTPAATVEQHQVGEFEFFAEYSLSKLSPTEIGSFSLTSSRPIVEQSFTVSSSRLIHLLVSSESKKSRNGDAAVWGTLVDSQNSVVAQLAMNHGDARSAPLVFLKPGDYKLILETGTRDTSLPVATKVRVYVDEISIDVGPGVIDPSTVPITCQSPGGVATPCIKHPTVILVEGPVYPDPAKLPPVPTYPSLPPWNNPPLFYWPILAPINPSNYHNSNNALDVNGDKMVTPMDVLLIINHLNSRQPTASNYYVDTNGDGFVSPIDALLVINSLNTQSMGAIASGEGPSTNVKVNDVVNGSLVDQAFAGLEDWQLQRKRK